MKKRNKIISPFSNFEEGQQVSSVARRGFYIPPKAILWFNLTSDEVAINFDSTGLAYEKSDYYGLAICNGSNGTPNLHNKFLRSNTSSAGATGGSDSSAHTHTTPAHQHQTDIGGDGASIYMRDDGAGLPYSGGVVENPVNEQVIASAASASGPGRFAKTRSDGSGTSGAASATDNKPAYTELVPLMKI